MNETRVNHLAVLCSAVVYWILGAIWFTALSNSWLVAIGKTHDQLITSGAKPVIAYATAFVCNLLIAYALYWVISRTGRVNIVRGVGVGLILWLGLVGPMFATEFVFEQRTIKAFLIIACYPLAGLLISGAILGGWRKMRVSATSTLSSSRAA